MTIATPTTITTQGFSKRAALLSVSDKTGLVPFARALHELGYILLSTSGTLKTLTENQIPVLSVEQYTGQAEILDGRVKTLHPKIHAGLLARRDSPEHMSTLEREGILPIDIAVINLYPFIQKLAQNPNVALKEQIEFIDVGGPTMIRGAAKNFASVLPVIDPSDYDAVLHFLRSEENSGPASIPFRRKLAAKVFTNLAAYEGSIAAYLTGDDGPESSTSEQAKNAPALRPLLLERTLSLRYGENPAQQAAWYRSVGSATQGWEQVGGKELSYNNLLDADAAVRITQSIAELGAACVIVKHTNPCGVAIRENVLEALAAAKQCDPRSHFGGILSFSRPVSAEVAQNIREDFAEVVIAPEFSEEALAILRTSKALRILRLSRPLPVTVEVRSALDGFLVQSPDLKFSAVRELPSSGGRAPSDSELADLELAWRLCAGVRSNAIVLVRNRMAVGVGAGQMSRIDSVELAVHKAGLHGHSLRGAVAASDAFFPFPDGLEGLIAAGVTAVVVPGGAKRDPEVLAVAQKAGIALLMAPERHFKH